MVLWFSCGELEVPLVDDEGRESLLSDDDDGPVLSRRGDF